MQNTENKDSTLCEIVNGRWERRGEHEYRKPESNP